MSKTSNAEGDFFKVLHWLFDTYIPELLSTEYGMRRNYFLFTVCLLLM